MLGNVEFGVLRYKAVCGFRRWVNDTELGDEAKVSTGE